MLVQRALHKKCDASKGEGSSRQVNLYDEAMQDPSQIIGT